MDRVTESLLNEFSAERGITHLPEDKRFEHFASFVTVGRHFSETFDTEDISVGKATGIDAIAIIVNGELITDVESVKETDLAGELDIMFIFVQADRSTSFDAGKTGGFGYAVVDFFKEKPTLPRNDEVTAAAAIMTELYNRSSKFKRGNPICRLYYITTGTWNNDQVLEARRQNGISDLKGTNMFREVSFDMIGAESLQKLYRQTRNAIECEFVFDKQVPIPEIPGVTQAYLGFLPVPEFRKIITDDRGDMIGGLFNSNPRDWQGYNEVNDEIKATLDTDAKKRFVLMNNGITIIAREVRPTGSKFLIGDYQIVNGCQTSHILFEQADKDDPSVMVPVRLIGTRDEGVINSIIRATNRQTYVTEDQFYALEEFPKQLEDFFQAYPAAQKLYYERRSRQYDRLSIEKTRIITQPNVIKAFAAMFLDEAHSTTRNYAALKAKVGKEIFGKQHRREPYYVAAFGFYKLDFLFRNSRLSPKYKPARFHILLAARRLAIGSALPLMNSKDMEKLCDKFSNILWDDAAADELLTRSVEVIDHVAAGEFDRDTIRTETFTKSIIKRCDEIAGT